MRTGTRAGAASPWDWRGQRPGRDRAAGRRGTLGFGDRRKPEGMDWVTALKAPAIAKLAADGGPLKDLGRNRTCISQIDEPAEIEQTERLLADLTIPASALRLV
jgi:hypothetical protein